MYVVTLHLSTSYIGLTIFKQVAGMATEGLLQEACIAVLIFLIQLVRLTFSPRLIATCPGGKRENPRLCKMKTYIYICRVFSAVQDCRSRLQILQLFAYLQV